MDWFVKKVLYKIQFLTIVVFVLWLACGCATWQERGIQTGDLNGGKVRIQFRSIGAYSQVVSGTIDAGGNVTVPISGVPTPIDAELLSTAMLAKSNIRIGDVTGTDIIFEFEIVGSGMQGVDSNEIKTTYENGTDREHIIIGDLAKQID